MKYFIQYAGMISASGSDARDFINRISSNDVTALKPDKPVKTFLLSDKGRIIDLVTLFEQGGFVYIMTSFCYTEKVLNHLTKYIVTDDVELSVCSNEFVKFIVTGKDPVSDVLTEVYKNMAKENGDNFFALYNDDMLDDTTLIVCPQQFSNTIRNTLSAGEFLNCLRYEEVRILAGVPEAPNEINEDINPLECGLSEYVSFKKGCYLGQEVIARLDSQDKIPKQMLLISTSGKIERENRILNEDNEECGIISSCVATTEGNIALGFIRSIRLDFAKKYLAETKSGKEEITITKISRRK